MNPAPDPAVAKVFASYPPGIRSRLKAIRRLIFDTAEAEAVGPLTETLKWGEPAYLTEQSKAGSTIRLGWKKSAPEQFALYFNCNTTLVDSFRTVCPELRYEGNRAIVIDESADPPLDSLRLCIAGALTYHRAKKAERKR